MYSSNPSEFFNDIDKNRNIIKKCLKHYANILDEHEIYYISIDKLYDYEIHYNLNRSIMTHKNIIWYTDSSRISEALYRATMLSIEEDANSVHFAVIRNPSTPDEKYVDYISKFNKYRTRLVSMLSLAKDDPEHIDTNLDVSISVASMYFFGLPNAYFPRKFYELFSASTLHVFSTDGTLLL